MDPTRGDESPISLPASVPDSQASGIADAGGKDEGFIKYWLREISDAHDREKDWRKSAMQAVDLYEANKQKEYQYNILYSNTETFAPALYNQVPRPVVTRRFKDPDPLGKICSDVVTRTLSYLADSNESEFPCFDEMMIQSTLEALVPGRGVVRFKHEVEFCEQEKPDGLQGSGDQRSESGEGNAGSNSGGAAASEAGEGEGEDAPEIEYETVVSECVPWERFTHGYAKQWRHVPWVCFDHYLTRAELCQNFGKELGARVQLTETEKESEEGSPQQDKWSKKRDDQKGVKLGLVHEIWNKVDHKVYFISPGLPKEVIKKCDDPLGVTGFLPMPEPLRFFRKIKTLVPTTLYAQYQEQHRELNRITVRINRIIGACKVRGMYDKRVSGIERLISQDDNTLLPAENIELFGEGSVNLDQVIWLWPLEKMVAALQILYTQREQIKSVIYDITGVADVMRGASKASETLGAQEIKEQWGSLRVSRMQKQVQNFARQCFRIMAEIAVTKLHYTTIAKITGLQYPTAEEKQKAQILMQQIQKQMQMLQQSMPPPQQGQQPPQPPPQLQQAAQQMQQLQQIISQPSWEDIIGVLGDTLTRTYRIDIETNSTIDPEATDDKEQIGELLNAIAQFVNGVLPMVESGAMPMETVKGMLLVIVRRFRFGPELEEYLEKIQQPPPKPDPQMQMAQVKMQGEQQKQQFEGQKLQMEMELQKQKHQQELEMMQQDAMLQQQKHTLEQQKLQQEAQRAQQEHDLALAKLSAEIQAARMMASIPQPMQQQPAAKKAAGAGRR